MGKPSGGGAAAERVDRNLRELDVHVVPVKVLLGVWALLVVLTVATVAATYVDLGRLNLIVALAIALVKASFVALYFMHLRYDNPFHGFILIFTLFFLAVFVGVALLDTLEYKPELIPGFAPGMK